MDWEMSLDEGLAASFTRDHRRIDQLWAELEQAVESGAADPNALSQSYVTHMSRHLAMEEEVLFPAFEAATGIRGGPTMMMRMEHNRMRIVMEQMLSYAASGDFDSVLDEGDTLHMLIQQHNAKEEGMLYPMAEMHVPWKEVAEKLASYQK